jgi:hypothetical protein
MTKGKQMSRKALTTPPHAASGCRGGADDLLRGWWGGWVGLMIPLGRVVMGAMSSANRWWKLNRQQDTTSEGTLHVGDCVTRKVQVCFCVTMRALRGPAFHPTHLLQPPHLLQLHRQGWTLPPLLLLLLLLLCGGRLLLQPRRTTG